MQCTTNLNGFHNPKYSDLLIWGDTWSTEYLGCLVEWAWFSGGADSVLRLMGY